MPIHRNSCFMEAKQILDKAHFGMQNTAKPKTVDPHLDFRLKYCNNDLAEFAHLAAESAPAAAAGSAESAASSAVQ